MNTTEIINEALAVLKKSGVILYPTDTVWGLGCDATNEKAVARIFEIKRRADSKSLVLLASDLDMVAKYVRQIPSMAIDLVEVNDTPMTIIYPQAQYLAANTVAQDGSVGIRIPFVDPEAPSGPAAFCRSLVQKLRCPLVSTSANISGEETPKNYKEISEEIISAVDYVVPASLERGASGKASQIIKLELDNQVTIIRG